MISTLLQAVGLQTNPKTQGRKRSPKWSALSSKVIAKAGGICAACGRVHQPNAHHIKPFNVFPELELEESNIIVLGEGGTINCHLWIGHNGRWDTYNPDVVEDCRQFREMLAGRKAG